VIYTALTSNGDIFGVVKCPRFDVKVLNISFDSSISLDDNPELKVVSSVFKSSPILLSNKVHLRDSVRSTLLLSSQIDSLHLLFF